MAEEISLEETNRLRAQVGLKPLTTESESAAADAGPAKTEDGEILVAPLLSSEVKNEAERREELESAREGKRARALILNSSSVLEDGKNDDFAAWAAAMTSKKQEPRKRAKVEETTEIVESSGPKLPEETPLEDLRVIHRAGELETTDAGDLILTLKDQPLLDRAGKLRNVEDVLETTGSRTQRSVAVSSYDPADDDEVDQDETTLVKLGLKSGSAYKFYDKWANIEEDSEDLLKKTRPLKELLAAPQDTASLRPSPRMAVQADSFTAAEYAALPKFKKKTKGKDAPKRDDLLDVPIKASSPLLQEGSEEDVLYAKLAAHRKAKLASMESVIEAATTETLEFDAPQANAAPSEPTPDFIEFTSTKEFCANLKSAADKDLERPEVRVARKREELMSDQQSEANEVSQEQDSEGPSSTAESGAPEIAAKEVTADRILEESQIESSMASALAVLRQKNAFEADKKWRLRRHVQDEALPQAAADDAIKIEHRDSFGRILTPKEAFRVLSWEFHGKGPGKRKQEKLLARIELEQKRGAASSRTDKLPTMNALKQAQRAGKPYVVLSGGSE